jgi:hypothetical protein
MCCFSDLYNKLVFQVKVQWLALCIIHKTDYLKLWLKKNHFSRRWKIKTKKVGFMAFLYCYGYTRHCNTRIKEGSSSIFGAKSKQELKLKKQRAKFFLRWHQSPRNFLFLAVFMYGLMTHSVCASSWSNVPNFIWNSDIGKPNTTVKYT